MLRWWLLLLIRLIQSRSFLQEQMVTKPFNANPFNWSVFSSQHYIKSKANEHLRPCTIDTINEGRYLIALSDSTAAFLSRAKGGRDILAEERFATEWIIRFKRNELSEYLNVQPVELKSLGQTIGVLSKRLILNGVKTEKREYFPALTVDPKFYQRFVLWTADDDRDDVYIQLYSGNFWLCANADESYLEITTRPSCRLKLSTVAR